VKRLLRIADLTNHVFLTMPEVLAVLPPAARSLQWRILELGEVVAGDDSGLDVLELEERVFASPTGLCLSFAELFDFARSTRQVIDGLFVATQPNAQPPRRSDADATILDRSEVVVAAFDSTFWLLSAPDAWLDEIARVFNDVHDEDPNTPLRAWGPSAS
jgi:hypothetical protein